MGTRRFCLISLIIPVCLFASGCSSTPAPSGESSNLLRNGSFEASGSGWLAPWRFEASGIATIQRASDTQAKGAYCASITLTESSPADHAVQLRQGNIPLVAGETYAFVFWAKASTSRAIRPDILHGAHPWTSYFSQVVALTTVWQRYTLMFTSSQTDANGMVLFNVAGAPGVVWISDVSLQASM